jgi:PAS domain S-box-containing protein
LPPRRAKLLLLLPMLSYFCIRPGAGRLAAGEVVMLEIGTLVATAAAMKLISDSIAALAHYPIPLWLAALLDCATVLTAVGLRALIVPSKSQLAAANRKLAREVAERERAETRFRGLVESAPDATVIVDAQGAIALINGQTERLFGYAREQLLGRPIEILMPERFRRRHLALREGYFKNPHPRTMGSGTELFGLRRDGVEFPLEVSLSPLATDEGLLVSSTIRDISERKRVQLELARARDEALEASRVKSAFVANMSHEVRTPLNGIIGFAQLLYDGRVAPDSAEYSQSLGDILSSARHLLRLINDLLDLAQVEAGRMKFTPEPTDPARLVEEVRGVLRGLADERRIHVEVAVAPGLGRVMVDSAKLKQVLYNYLSNALKFADEDSCVTVRMHPEGKDWFQLEVEDRGEGIRAEDIEHLFTEFRQLDSSFSRRHEGTGLGLALTKRIVEAQGGKVGVRSQPGKGSTFWAMLPRSFPFGDAPRAVRF